MVPKTKIYNYKFEYDSHGTNATYDERDLRKNLTYVEYSTGTYYIMTYNENNQMVYDENHLGLYSYREPTMATWGKEMMCSVRTNKPY